MPSPVVIYDTTLRDGCQGLGVALALNEKLAIARRLDQFGVDYIEAGWPLANPKDTALFEHFQVNPLRKARLVAFGSTRRPGVAVEDDPGLAGLVQSKAPAITLVAKTWRRQVELVLSTSAEENLAMVHESVAFLRTRGREVMLDAEHFFDAYSEDPAYALAVLEAAQQAGASWLVLCDTRGGALPERIGAAVAAVHQRHGDCIGIHAHNDADLAIANTLAAVQAGALQVQGTINGYGERCGNTNLCSLLPTLRFQLGRRFQAADQLDQLTPLSKAIDGIAHLKANPRLPFVGQAAFAHKGGLHVAAVRKDPSCYEHLSPDQVGNQRRVLLSDQAGRHNILALAERLHLRLDPDGELVRQIAAQVKVLESQGFQFEQAEASIELLLRRQLPGYQRPFKPISYEVTSRSSPGQDGSQCLASVEVALQGELLLGRAQGGGPIDGLEKALRMALMPVYPSLADLVLVDFQAEIAGGGSEERAPIRVMLTARNARGQRWCTVGSASDLIQASWLALIDVIEQELLSAAEIPDGARRVEEPLPWLALAPRLRRCLLQPDDIQCIRRIQSIDWRTNVFDLSNSDNRAEAARATALGAALFYSFGNFCAIAARPELESVQRVNLIKGRPINQVGSITTTRRHLESVFDWDQLPSGLTPEQLLGLIDALLEIGPIGVRGPASPLIPSHLSSLDAGCRTTQLISPGLRCRSNALLDAILDQVPYDFLFITSANISSGRTGQVEPAHVELQGMQRDFGGCDGVVMIGHRDEAAVRRSYPDHLAMSTSIVAFHALAAGEGSNPCLILERHGSLAAERIRDVASRFSLDLRLGAAADARLPMRSPLGDS